MHPRCALSPADSGGRIGAASADCRRRSTYKAESTSIETTPRACPTSRSAPRASTFVLDVSEGSARHNDCRCRTSWRGASGRAAPWIDRGLLHHAIRHRTRRAGLSCLHPGTGDDLMRCTRIRRWRIVAGRRSLTGSETKSTGRYARPDRISRRSSKLFRRPQPAPLGVLSLTTYETTLDRLGPDSARTGEVQHVSWPAGLRGVPAIGPTTRVSGPTFMTSTCPFCTCREPPCRSRVRSM